MSINTLASSNSFVYTNCSNILRMVVIDIKTALRCEFLQTGCTDGPGEKCTVRHGTSLTWNNDVSITQDRELHRTKVLGPGREPGDTHHNWQLGNTTDAGCE